MTYATLADLEKRTGPQELVKISDRDRDGAADLDVIDAALGDADNLINGYVAVKYATPLPSVPAIVQTWAVSIARYILWKNGAPEHVAADYKEAIAALKDVARGLIALPVGTGEVAPSAQSGTVMASHPPQVFTAAKLRGW